MSGRLTPPLPCPYTGPDVCRACLGYRVTGERREVTVPGGRLVVAEVLCPRCGGCGRSMSHRGCGRDEHYWRDRWWSRDGDGHCRDCHGTGWSAVSVGGPGWLRVPCPCPGVVR